jgi:hypothetical protein
VLMDNENWEENKENEDLFRPDIYLGLFIIKRLLPNPESVIWDLSPCPGPSFYNLLGMPLTSAAPCWFGAIYSLNAVCHMSNCGRDGIPDDYKGAYFATCAPTILDKDHHRATLMQDVIQYLLTNHGIMADTYFKGTDGAPELSTVQNAVRLVTNIALAAPLNVQEFKNFTYWLYYQHKPDHACNANFYNAIKLAEGASKIADAGKGLYAKTAIKTGDVIGHFLGRWIDRGSWKKEMLTHKTWGGPDGNYEFATKNFPDLWTRHLA